MNVNRNSWHYRLQDELDLQPNKRADLCSYMRGVVFSLLIGLLMPWFFGGGAIVMSLIWYYLARSSFIVLSGVIAWTVAALAMWVIILFEYFNLEIPWPKIALPRFPSISLHRLEGLIRFITTLFRQHVHRPSINLNDSITIQWLKAKKHRICPLITFE